MNKQTEIEFKSLLSKSEYDMLMNHFAGNKTNEQTNHYFDTPRFSLKAADSSLRVRERDNKFELTLKKKKGYNQIECTIPITKEEFEQLKENYESIKNDLFGGLDIQIGYCNGSNTKLNSTSEQNKSICSKKRFQCSSQII